MRNEHLIPRRTPESRAATDRVQVVMELTSRLNVQRHSDVEARTALLSEILGRPMPETVTIYPPFYCDYGLNLEFGERLARTIINLRDTKRLDSLLAAAAIIDLDSHSRILLNASLVHAAFIHTGRLRTPGGLRLAA